MCRRLARCLFQLILLSTVLRIKRTVEGPEIDKIISDRQARKAAVFERIRRAQWQQRVENAAAFDHG